MKNSARRKKRTSFKRRASKKGLDVSQTEGGKNKLCLFFFLPKLHSVLRRSKPGQLSADLLLVGLVSQESKWRPFMLKPLPSPLMKPILVFVNPKSGGNQVRSSGRKIHILHPVVQQSVVIDLER